MTKQRTDAWKLIIREDRGNGRLAMLDESGAVLGTATMSWIEYQQLVRRVARILLEESFDTIRKSLGKLIWHQARLGSENSEDIAMKRLTELGFNQETWELIAGQLAQEVVARMTQHMPEHRG